ncbi:hypothetical protein BJ166DRAFT_494111 [Pestalotiopsis sp. NC0098]|nr:hypothetical protein BJ166DRAFT_494111 [Pestalotiopsis sp. NC0098]
MKEVAPCHVMWPEKDEDHPLNFHCWLNFPSIVVKKGEGIKLQEFVFNYNEAYEFQDFEAPAVVAKLEVSETASRAIDTSTMYTHLAQFNWPLTDRKRLMELGLVVYVSKFPPKDSRDRFVQFLRGVGVAPCKLFWPRPVFASDANHQCWLEFSEPGHAAAATKILTGAPFWGHLRPYLTRQSDPIAPFGGILDECRVKAHATSVYHLVDGTTKIVRAAHDGESPYPQELFYNTQTTSKDIENWVQLGLLVLVWGFSKFAKQKCRVRDNRKRLENIFRQKGVAPCTIIWPHRSLSDFFWLKFSHPDHAAGAIKIICGVTIEGGFFSVALGDRPEVRTSAAMQDDEAQCDEKEKKESYVPAQDPGCASATSSQS